MTSCLERVLASDYDKLEIIVLDDSSVDNTSVLIKSFAHAGVRFVEGSPLPKGWLGKNHALQGLLDESSGSYLLYLDVDTFVEPHTISTLVKQAASQKLAITSVVPQRQDGLRASVFLGTLRYFWMLLLDRRRLPAVSGSTWLVERHKLLEIGGFSSFSGVNQPEVPIARALNAPNGSQLIISTPRLGVSYEKRWSSQVETSIRLLRPQFVRPLVGMAVAVWLIMIVLTPFIGLFYGFLIQNISCIVLSGLALFLTSVASLTYFKAVWLHGWWLGALHWPYILIQEAIIMLVSIIRYARGTVTWKGRTITVDRSELTA
jgi:glycosyltransferase involved in cell wall biosynthesis